MNKKEIFDNLNPPKVGTNSVAANGFRGTIPGGYIKMNTPKNPFRCEAGNSDFHCEAGSKLPDDIVNNLPDDYYPSEFQDNGEWISGELFNEIFKKKMEERNENMTHYYDPSKSLTEPLDTPKPEPNQPGMLNYGWICPKCGSVLAPWVRECPHCGNQAGKQIEIRFQKPLDKDGYDFHHQYEPEHQPTVCDPINREPSTAEPLFESTTSSTSI